MLVMTAGFFLTFAATFVTAVLSLIDILRTSERSLPPNALPNISFQRASYGHLSSTCALPPRRPLFLLRLGHPRFVLWLASTITTQLIFEFSQMIFELLVLAAVSWNVFDRPREAHLPLRRALHRDGITFFAVRTITP